MLAEDIKFPGIWISKNEDEECEVITTFKSQISNDIIVAVKGIKGMSHYDSLFDTIPFSLDVFMRRFEPKLES